MKNKEVHIKNQLIRQRKDKSSVDKIGNPRFRLFLKEGNSTMLLAKGLTKNQILILTTRIKNDLETYGSKLEGNFITVK